jgi:hypothetical protein
VQIACPMTPPSTTPYAFSRAPKIMVVSWDLSPHSATNVIVKACMNILAIKELPFLAAVLRTIPLSASIKDDSFSSYKRQTDKNWLILFKNKSTLFRTTDNNNLNSLSLCFNKSGTFQKYHSPCCLTKKRPTFANEIEINLTC